MSISRLIIKLCLCMALLCFSNCLNNGRKSRDQNELPYFRGSDIHGEVFDSASLSGRYAYFQFLGKDIRGDENLLLSASSKFHKNLNMIIIGNESMSNAAWLKDFDAIILPDEGQVIRRLFNAPNFGYFVIFDPWGKRIGYGMNQAANTGELRSILQRHIGKLNYKYNMLIPDEGHVLSIYPWLEPLAQRAQSSSRFYIAVGLFTSICEGCYSGALLAWLKQLQSVASDYLEIWCLVSPEFSDNDIQNLTHFLKLDFPVVTADGPLAHKWNEMATTFGSNRVNAILFLVNRDGLVLNVHDESDPPGDFFQKCLEFSNKAHDEN